MCIFVGRIWQIAIKVPKYFSYNGKVLDEIRKEKEL